MANDPYQILGVPKDASQEAIQKAYRRLAKKLHPDLNPGDAGAEGKFKEVSAAYDLLGDAEKRGRFDRGEIDASGAERPQPRYYRDFAQDRRSPYASDDAFVDLGRDEDLLSQILGRRGRVRMRGQDVQYGLQLDFLDAVNGTKTQVTLPPDQRLDITIPPGTADGQILRLRGKGGAGLNGGPAGDALIEISIRPHPLFTRKGDDIHLELPVGLHEAVLGGKIEVPTPAGTVAMTVPKWSDTGAVLRLKGRGVPRSDGSRGDAYVTLKLVLPREPDSELEDFLKQSQSRRGYNPPAFTRA